MKTTRIMSLILVAGVIASATVWMIIPKKLKHSDEGRQHKQGRWSESRLLLQPESVPNLAATPTQPQRIENGLPPKKIVPAAAPRGPMATSAMPPKTAHMVKHPGFISTEPDDSATLARGSDRVRAIVNLDGTVTHAARYKALQALGVNASAEEIEALYEFLASALPTDQSGKDWERGFRNDVLTKLREQENSPAGLTDQLLAIHQDRQQDIVMRDYALQHLSFWYEEKAGPDEQQQIQNLLWTALKETDSSIAGSTLLALHRLGLSHSEFAQSDIAEAALRLATDERCGELARITALQICAQLGVKDALPLALQFAESAKSIPLKVSAIAAIGQLGGAEVTAYLENLAAGKDTRLAVAARAALQRRAWQLSAQKEASDR
jgi:hypothetical protein